MSSEERVVSADPRLAWIQERIMSFMKSVKLDRFKKSFESDEAV